MSEAGMTDRSAQALRPVGDESGDLDGEASALGARLARALDASGTYYRQSLGMPGPVDDDAATRAAALPPDRLTWHGMSQAAAVDPEAGGALWRDVCRAARHEIECGHRAAVPLEASDSTPMERALFLALRRSLMDEWQPRGGVEQALIDQMAQALTLQQYWTAVLTRRGREQVTVDNRDTQRLRDLEPKGVRLGEWMPPRLTSAEATQEAAGMVDRWNRMFLRTLRQLRDLRRYTVVVQNAGQVNVGEKQINVASRIAGPPVQVPAGGRRKAKRRRPQS